MNKEVEDEDGGHYFNVYNKNTTTIKIKYYHHSMNFGGCKKFCVNRHFAGNCNFQKWNKNDYTIIIT